MVNDRYAQVMCLPMIYDMPLNTTLRSASVTRGGEGPLRLAVSGIVLPLTHSAAVAQAGSGSCLRCCSVPILCCTVQGQSACASCSYGTCVDGTCRCWAGAHGPSCADLDSSLLAHGGAAFGINVVRALVITSDHRNCGANVSCKMWSEVEQGSPHLSGVD